MFVFQPTLTDCFKGSHIVILEKKNHQSVLRKGYLGQVRTLKMPPPNNPSCAATAYQSYQEHHKSPLN